MSQHLKMHHSRWIFPRCRCSRGLKPSSHCRILTLIFHLQTVFEIADKPPDENIINTHSRLTDWLLVTVCEDNIWYSPKPRRRPTDVQHTKYLDPWRVQILQILQPIRGVQAITFIYSFYFSPFFCNCISALKTFLVSCWHPFLDQKKSWVEALFQICVPDL